ncbi:MAG: trypsin-like serine protease [Gemmatimonadota bacterium]
MLGFTQTITRRFLASALGLTLAVTTSACRDSAGPAAPETLRGSDAPSLIVNGTPDESGAWPAVGALMFDQNADGIFEARERICTGSLISPTHFLTAAHCAFAVRLLTQLEVTQRYAVSFDADLKTMSNRLAVVDVTVDPRYAYTPSLGAKPVADMAIVTLAAGQTTGITPMRLPAPGAIDAARLAGLFDATLIVNVGYGIGIASSGYPIAYRNDYLRMVSRSPYMATTPTYFGLLMNVAATGEGGDCNGDSGGPKMLDRDGYRDVVLAIVVTGDQHCRASSWNWRLDTDAARSFLGQFVPLP